MVWPILGVLVAAGAAIVVQNLLMARITGAASSVLVALVLNSAVGLVLLLGLLIRKSGIAGIADVAGQIRPWMILPGLLGSYFVFASITGYQRIGAGPTIAVLVASQLLFGLVWDLARAERVAPQDLALSGGGALLLVAGVVMIALRGRWGA